MLVAPIVLTLLPHDDSIASSSARLSSDDTCSNSSHDTMILSPDRGSERHLAWPLKFPLPKFAYDTDLALQRGNDLCQKNGTLLNTPSIKSEVLNRMADAIYQYTAYPSGAQISDAAEVLIKHIHV